MSTLLPRSRRNWLPLHSFEIAVEDLGKAAYRSSFASQVAWLATRSSQVASNSPPSLASISRELWWEPFACIPERRVEAPPGFEPGVEVLQTSALPLGDGAPETARGPIKARAVYGRPKGLRHTLAANDVGFRTLAVSAVFVHLRCCAASVDNLRAKGGSPTVARSQARRAKVGAGNGIRTRDFDLGKVALYH